MAQTISSPQYSPGFQLISLQRLQQSYFAYSHVIWVNCSYHQMSVSVNSNGRTTGTLTSARG